MADARDDEDDDNEAVAVDRKRGRPDSLYALKKQEKDAKKKKGRVFVEVIAVKQQTICLFILIEKKCLLVFVV